MSPSSVTEFVNCSTQIASHETNPIGRGPGPGVGMSCNVCELPVTKTDSEVAIQFAYDGADPHQDQFHLHVRCFAAWELERNAEGG